MKLIWPAVAAGLLLWPLSASAQGYSGVMPPQQGYHPPAGTSAPAAPAATDSGGDFGSPYSGTGTSNAGGYASLMSNGTGNSDYAEQDAAPQGDADPPVHATSPFMDSFAPKTKDDGGQGGASIYDQIDNNTGTPTERRRKAIIRKVEAEQRKEQADMKRAREAHDREVRAYVTKTVKDQQRKAHGDDGLDNADDDSDQPQDDGADDMSTDGANQ